MKVTLQSLEQSQRFGLHLGRLLKGGEVIELVGDVGAGKTALTKAIATGMGIDGEVQSPTFTLSREYDAPNGLRLVHYDFYRLSEPGIMAAELQESVGSSAIVTVVEWGEIVHGVMPIDRLTITMMSVSEHARELVVTAGGARSRRLIEELQV